MRPLHRILVLVCLSAVALASAGGLWAYFTATGTDAGAATARAARVEAGSTPIVTSTGADSIALEWGETALANGEAVDGYEVRRYAVGESTPTVLAGCVAAGSCTVTSIPDGAWEFTVTPLKGNHWRGPESDRSGTLIVGPTGLDLDQPLVAALPGALTGRLFGFKGGEAIGFRLDGDDGDELAGSPVAAGPAGSADVAIAVPAGTSDGPHTVYAVGAGGSLAAAPILVDTTAPTSSALGTIDGWHTSAATITLSADDGITGSGVASIAYRLDDGAEQTVEGPTAEVAVTTDGPHTLTFYATDNAGHAESPAQSVSVHVDTHAPATTLATAPAGPDGSNGWFRQSSVAFTLSATDGASGVAARYYTVDGGAAQSYAAPVTLAAQGDHTITYWSVDNAGNTETAGTAHVKLDDIAPATTLATSPVSSDGSYGWFKQASVSFTLAATDITSGVAGSFYTVDGGATQTYAGAVTIATQGDHTVTYWSADYAGNGEATRTVHIKLDDVAPATTVDTSPASPDGSNGWFKQSSVSFTLGSTDAASGISGRFYKLDGGATQAYAGAVTVSTQGEHTVQCWAVDNAGNTEPTSTVHIKLDSVAPSTSDNTASIGSGWKTTNQTVTLTRTEATSGIAATHYTTDGGTPTASSSQGSSISLTADGIYTIKYFSVDNAGNTEPVKTAANQVRIDKTAPVVTGAVVANNSTNTPGLRHNVAYAVYANVSETGSGISTVTANLSALGNGTSVTLSPCSTGCTIAGTTYAYKSASQTASTTVGTKTFTITAVDVATNSSGAASFSVVVDDTNPSVTAKAIADAVNDTAGFVRAGGDYFVYANVSDAAPSSGIASVTGNVTNFTSGVTATPMTTAGGPWTIGGVSYGYRSGLLTVGSGVTSGNKAAQVTATDNAGNTGSTTSSNTANVDNTAPSTTAARNPLANAAGWNNADVTVTLSASDANAGVRSITYAAEGAQPNSTTVVAGASATVSISTEGSTAITYFATDNVGNVETAKTVTVNLDKQSPTAGALSLPTPIRNGQALANPAATDALSGVAGVAYYYCPGTCTPSPGTLIGTATTGPAYTLAWSSQPADGTYSVVARVTDAAGNSVDSQVATTTIDNTRPAVVAVTLADGGTAKQVDSGDTVTITYSEQLDAASFCSAWSNAGPQTLSDVTVTITQSGTTDGLTVGTPSCTLHLGTIVPGDYVSATTTFSSSTVSWNPATKQLTITVGTYVSGTIRTGQAATKPKYTPDSALSDLAGNTVTATTFTDNTTSGF
jgi:hypothetical protein